MQKIAILHSGNLNDISPGGISEYVSQFIGFSSNEIYLLGTERKDSDSKLRKPYKRKVNEKEYTFIPINYNDKRPLSLFYFFNILFFMITNRNLFKNIDIFYAQRMEYILPFCLFFRSKNVVMAVHGSGRYATMFWGKVIAKIYLFLEYISIGRATKVFVLNNNAEFGVPYYKAHYSRFKDKIFYTLVPVNQDLFRPLNKDKVRKKNKLGLNEKIILFLGRIENNPKRVHLLPDILKKVQNIYPKTKLLIIGSGNDKGDLVNKLKQINLLNDTVFIDYVKHGQELVELVNCANVSLVCSSFEGICMSALESISSGVPVIATNVGDIKEYLINGKNGYLINRTSEKAIIDEMVSSILKVFNKELRTNPESIQRFNVVNVIQETENLLLK